MRSPTPRPLTWLAVLGLLAQAACVTSVSREAPLEHWSPAEAERSAEQIEGDRSSEMLVLLAFSGGGTRAAAFSYGVLQELAATEVTTEHGPRPLHREVDVISSVSGGSFTSAYFALHGDRIFDDFEERFLRKDIERALFWEVVRPRNWLKLGSRSYGRSDLAAEYYSRNVFDRATFADLQRPDAPALAINATDLGSGLRFSFDRDSFDVLCADFDRYPVGRAVAASSAVPGLLSPVSLENFAGSCGYQPNPILERVAADPRRTIERSQAEAVLEIMDREQRPWLHLVDGGIADNLGLRFYWMRAKFLDGLEPAYPSLARPGPHQVLLILVNAIARPQPSWLHLSSEPSLMELIGSVSAIELARYDLDTIELLRESFRRWIEQESEAGRPLSFHFVEVDFASVPDAERRDALNDIRTNFDLDDADVDALIEAGREVLRSSPDFRAFLDRNRELHPAR